MNIPSFNIHPFFVYWLRISYLKLDVKLNFHYLDATPHEALHKTLGGNPESIIM